MSRLTASVVLVASFLLSASVASAATVPVAAQFSAFGPGAVDLLPGETVEWENVSERRHTVTADDGAFESGDLFSGQKYSQTFAAPGTYRYHCRVHDGMTGVVEVQQVTIGPLPTAAVPAGQRVALEGRTADPGQLVRIERAVDGRFTTVAVVQASVDGGWRTSVPAERTADYRAANAAGASSPRRLLVSDRRVDVRATRRGIAVAVKPALPYARIVVERVTRERFGWWPTIRTRLDYVSRASIRIARPARLRVVLVDRDGWTALATSRVIALGRESRGAPPTPAPPTPVAPQAPPSQGHHVSHG